MKIKPHLERTGLLGLGDNIVEYFSFLINLVVQDLLKFIYTKFYKTHLIVTTVYSKTRIK